MNESKGEQFNEEEPVIPEIQPEHPQVEMSEDFEDLERKSGKWKTVKEEVGIEGKKSRGVLSRKTHRITQASARRNRNKTHTSPRIITPISNATDRPCPGRDS